MEIIAISAVVGAIAFGFGIVCGTNSPSPFSLEDFERERRIRAENEATRIYRELESMRIQNIRLSSFPLYQSREPFKLEIQKLPRAGTLKDAQEKYGKNWDVTDGIIGKLNEVIEEVNNPTIKRI